MWNRCLTRVLAASLLTLGLAACHHDDDDPPPAVPVVPSVPSPTFSIGGTVTGATGPLTLQNSNGTTLAVPASGAFTFATEMVNGASYNVTVAIPPPSQTCTVANGAGTVGIADITNIAVTCTANGYTLGGTVSGLGAGKNVVLRAQADFVSGNLTVSANGAFTFPLEFVNNAEWEVNVFTQPAGQTCTVVNGSGDITGASVTNIAVTCIDSSASARNWTDAAVIVSTPDLLDENHGVNDPQVAYDANGNAIAVWTSDRPNDQGRDISWSRYTPAGGWSTPGHIERRIELEPSVPLVESRTMPRLVVHPNGNAVVVWREFFTGFAYHIGASFYTPAGGWSPPEWVYVTNVTTPPVEHHDVDSLKIAGDAANNVIVVWESAGHILSKRHAAGAGWSSVNTTREQVSELTPLSIEPELAMSPNGVAVAIWKQRDGADPVISYDMAASRYDLATDTWSTPQLIETDETGGVFYNSSVVVDPTGVATAVWSQYDGTRLHILYNRMTGASWGTATILETNNDGPQSNALDPRAAVDGNGNVTALWLQSDSEEGHYVVNRYVPGVGWGTQRNIGEYVGVGSLMTDTQFALVGNAAGDVVAVWTLHGGVGAENVLFPHNVWANEYNAATDTWGAPEVIDKDPVQGDPDQFDSVNPSVAIGANGDAVAVWEKIVGDGGDNGIRTSRFEQ